MRLTRLSGTPVERLCASSNPLAQFCFEPVNLVEEF